MFGEYKFRGATGYASEGSADSAPATQTTGDQAAVVFENPE